MSYCKITKKYSHCQYIPILSFCSQRGFFIIEFVYTLFVVTGFIWIISLYLMLNIRWQQWASNQLMALSIARDALENILLEKPLTGTSKNGRFIIEFHQKEFPLSYHIPYLNKQKPSAKALNVIVTWHDDTGHKYGLTLESY